jgi:tRNA(adenine34) deaminase
MCAGALFWAQLGSLVYGADDEKRGYTLLKSPILHPKTKVVKGILENESVQLMKAFFAKKRK